MRRLILLLAIVFVAGGPARAGWEAAATVTVSGVVRGPAGPLANAWIGVGSNQDWQTDATGADGRYSVTIQTDGALWFNVRPPLSARVSQANHRREGVAGDLVLDFDLPAGYLLSVLTTGSGGEPLTDGIGFDVQPLERTQSDPWWYSLDWEEVAGRFQAVLPEDVYYLYTQGLPEGYYSSWTAIDLRTGDQQIDLPLSTTYVHPWDFDPPDAGNISVGPPDDLGEATVTGSAGAALPLAHVLLVNLNSAHQAHVLSQADGSFQAKIFAPPGSALMVKHGPANWRWNALEVGVSEQLNPMPGTILNLPHTHTADAPDLPFAAAGAVEHRIDDPPQTRNYVGSAWAMAGAVGPLVVPGEWDRVLDGAYNGEEVPGLYLGGLNWTHPALADLDADGDLELLVGERSGQLVLYRNAGSAAEPDWRFEDAAYAGVDTGGWAYPALADVNGDQAPDLFVGLGSGTVSIYYNDGSPASAAWPGEPDVSLAAGSDASPALDDLDGDGDLDLVVGQQGAALWLYRNTGSATQPQWTLESDAYDGIAEAGGWLQPAFVDLDGDADRDLLVGLCGSLVWYRRSGPANPTWTRVAADPVGYGGGSCGTSPATGDWDGDGDRDLAVGEHWGVLRFFRNGGPPAWAEEGFPFPIDLAGDTAPALADWDGDGDLDLLVGQAHGELHQYTNQGDAHSPDWRADGILFTLPWANHPHPFPAFADIDGDGDQDLFVGEGDFDGPDAGGQVRFYRNQGTPAAPNWVPVTDHFLDLNVGGWSTPAFADIDADNDLDLFVGDGQGTLTFVQNTGTPTAPDWAAPQQPYAGLELGDYSAPALLDLDGDGDLDLLVSQAAGSLAFVRNDGTAQAPAWKLVAPFYPGLDVGERSIPAAADLDGDGLDDLLLGDGDGGLDLYLYAGPGAPPPSTGAYEPGDSFQVEATLRIYSPAIGPGVDLGAIHAGGWLNLLMLHNQAGGAIPAENYYQSSLLTPTGFPIQGISPPVVPLERHCEVQGLRYAGGHTLEGQLTCAGEIPADLPAGIYRPFIGLRFEGVPANTDWVAANVVYHTFNPHQAALPPITVGQVEPPRLPWWLLMDNLVQGTRGTAAREDQGHLALASQIVTQGAPYYTPPIDEPSGQPLTFRLEPFLPTLSYTDRRMPTPPLLPLALPGGQLEVSVQKPDGTLVELGSEAFSQSFNRTKTTRAGADLNVGTVQIDDVYSLQTASNRFRIPLDQYGHYVVTMMGEVEDLWGNRYQGGGTYDLWAAHALDIDPGVLPGTPLAAGDAFNPTLQFYPAVPADVTLTVQLHPQPDPTLKIEKTVRGQANPYGQFSPGDAALTLPQAGEYRVDLTATYTDPAGKLYMGAMTWGGVVMTPPGETQLVAHGRRGLDSLQYIPNQWFVSSRDLTIPAGAVSHTLNPYQNGDLAWSRMADNAVGGDSLVLGASVEDPVGVVEAAVWARAQRWRPPTAAPGSLEERFQNGEIPLFISTRSGWPAQIVPDQADQIAYSYRSSQRPGIRVRELVAEDSQSGGYWRLDTLYDDQLGVGIQGDLPIDYKFQYVGVVYRDLASGHSEYLGQGTGWVFLPDEDVLGSRVMPPFAGAGNGGWTTEGGPILTLKGEEMHLFILPTGTQPGAVLEVGDTFRFAGHLMPTLPSELEVRVTAPSGASYLGGGQANPVGYFYDPADDLTVDEAGPWAVDVRAWHDGPCSGGQTQAPYPSGGVLGSEAGRFWFYAVPPGSPLLAITSPKPGFLPPSFPVAPVAITGPVPAGLTGVTVDYTIGMPGTILEHGQVVAQGGTFTVTYDPVALQEDFPNLDLIGRDDWRSGLADTVWVGLLLRGQGAGGGTVYRANRVTLQGNQVFVGEAPAEGETQIYLPLVLRGAH